MLRIVLIETVYPAPEDDEDDYCPDGDTSTEEVEVGFKSWSRSCGATRTHRLPLPLALSTSG
jgi:hypothetical protein